MSAEETDVVQLFKDFHSLYRTFHVKKNERKRRDKSSKPKIKQKNKPLDSVTSVVPLSMPKIEVLGNCSIFSVYANVRQLVLELNFADSCRKWLISADDTEVENDNSSEKPQSPVALPKIIGIGLEAVFQLIQECHSVHPGLCIKALEALLNILEGQHPQSLRKEPPAVLDSIFTVLLDLSKSDWLNIPSSSSSTVRSTQLTSVATSCLISLAIARGDTKSILEAITSLFQCEDSAVTQELKNPELLKALQKSTEAILVGRPVLPQWLNHGIPKNACVDSFKLSFPEDPSGSVYNAKTLASDGRFLFLHCSRGLYKIGSGCFGTVQGHVYAKDEKFHNQEKCWIGWCKDKLYYHVLKPNDAKMHVLSQTTLRIVETFNFSENITVTFFTDGNRLGYIMPSREDGFLVRTMSNETFDPKDYINEFNIRLVRKSIECCGPGPWDGETALRPIFTGTDDDVSYITAGKDFALLRTQHGKILYCGKGASLGQKSGISKCTKWMELGLSKCPRFIQCAVGHEGIHALLLADDGTAYFVGTPKRGEDGDQGKARRVCKASKPKKVIRMEGQDVTYVACNNGTSAFVTRNGDLYMFGKDTTHCDPVTGLVTGLRGISVAQIAMGKAHSIILSADGKVFTMGMNNRGQCGRSLPPPKDDDLLDDDDAEWDESTEAAVIAPPILEQEGMCPPGTHRWKHEQCMVCTICRECTGYGSACISALRPDRNPGQECGCGVGDAGCAECGSCRTCAREGLEDADYLILDAHQGGIDLIPDLVRVDEDGRLVDGAAISEEHLDRRPSKASSSNTRLRQLKPRGKDNVLTSSSPPTRLSLPTTYPITQVACGLYHSVFLDTKGTVFICGSNTMGQLGVGDLVPRQIPVRVRFPDADCKIVQIAGGSYHSIALDANGVVYTSGAHTKGQLGRDEDILDAYWHTTFLPLDNVGVACGRRVTWIGSTGDSTVLKLEACLISPKILRKSTVMANPSGIVIIPPPFHTRTVSSILINRRDGSCTYFEGENQWSISTSAATLDPVYDFLWTYEWKIHMMKCHNVIASAARNPSYESNMWLLRPPFAIPMASGSKLQRWQAGANLLACIDTLVATHIQGLSVQPEEQAVVPSISKMYTRDDYSALCRFENHGGGWGYSGHSIEAIRFSCDTDILLGGFGLFGGRGEYCAKIKLYDIGLQGGDVEGDGELLSETEEIPFDCSPRQKYRMMFEEPVALQPGRWYVAWAHISGPSSDCGSTGQTMIVSDDQVTFHFKSSKISNNGTDVNAGQIPQILYRLLSSDQRSSGNSSKLQVEPIYILSSDFLSNFSHGSLQVLTDLFEWCRVTIRNSAVDEPVPEDEFKMNLLKFIACSCLRLMEFSINQVYPLNGCGRPGQMESLSMAEAIGNVRTVLQAMISDDMVGSCDYLDDYSEEILSQCCDTYVNCFQVFYPTAMLKWDCFSHFLYFQIDEGSMYIRLFSSVIWALCSCRGQLLNIFPILSGQLQSPDETSITFVTNTEGGKLKQPSNNRLLVAQMVEKSRHDYYYKMNLSFWEAIRYLLSIIQFFEERTEDEFKILVYNASLLVGKLVEELVCHASGAYGELENVIGQVIVSTPSRFSRTNQSRTWNTGNGSPDAVCFAVDQPGVSVFGACIYSGTGSYEYELEIFQEVEDFIDNSDQQGPKWTSLELARGSFDSDDCVGDVAEIRFPRALHIKAGTKYAIRLKNQGGRTCNGDGGISVLRCPDGTTFTFSSCALSFNGTNQIRGQIPYILYFRNPDDSDTRQKAKVIAEMEARKCAIRLCGFVFENMKSRLNRYTAPSIMQLSNSTFVTTLVPSVLAHLPQLAKSDPRSCVELLELIRGILPDIAELNNIVIESLLKTDKKLDSNSGVHYAWVESEHPYKPAALSHYKVAFPSTVQRMTVEFDPRCCTAQVEDSLRLYIPFGADFSQYVNTTSDEMDALSSYIPIVDRYSGSCNWPQKAVILPGNEVLFSLETASDYVRADKIQYFGFRCLVSGFEWKDCSGLSRVEMEMAYLGGFCTHELIKKDLVLPPVSAEEVKTPEDGSSIEEKMIEICLRHHSLFAKGIGLEYFPTVQEALEGIVPLREKSKEREFIADFIARTPNTSGERLANWLQPESFVDPQKCEVVPSKETLRRCRSTVLMVVTRDQHGEAVVAQNLQVEMKATPLKAGRLSNSHFVPIPSYKTTGEIHPEVEIPFQVTVKDKMRYHAITMMKEYENFSFEELRLLSPAARRLSESMLVRSNNNGTYTVSWTPANIGRYHISLTIDGYSIPEACSVEVEEALEGTFTCTKKPDDSTEFPASFPTSKMRKFKATDSAGAVQSAGLRVRSHPTLQSEQIGCLPVNGVITFTQEVHNDDGIWVKLDETSILAFCKNVQARSFQLEGWCLQYNQHIGKTFLFPIEGSKPLPGVGFEKSSHTVRKLPDFPFPTENSCSKVLRLNGSPGLYQVVKCGVAGHNIRTRPCLRSPPVGILALGSKFYAVDECYNNEGLWLKLDGASQRKFCFTNEGEGWSLAVGRGDIVYLRQYDTSKSKTGFDFSVASRFPQNVFQDVSPPAAFGSIELPGIIDRAKATDSFDSSLEDAEIIPMISSFENTHIRTELDDNSQPMVEEKSIDTKVETSSNVLLPQKSEVILRRPSSDSDQAVKPAAARSRSSSTFGALQKWLQIGTDGHTFGRASSASPQPFSTKQTTSVLEASKTLVKDRIYSLGSSKTVTVCTGTQTSPSVDVSASSMVPTGIQFTIGISGPLPNASAGTGLNTFCSGKPASKSERKHKSSPRVRPSRRDREKERAINLTHIPGVLMDAPAKEAVGPGHGQSIRAVFGAILWHAGIIHDAMACAAYFRFHKPSVQSSASRVLPFSKDCFSTVVNQVESLEYQALKRSQQNMFISATAPLLESEAGQIKSEYPAVIIRRRNDRKAPVKMPLQRHSVEVTTAAWYLKENPEVNLEPLNLPPHISKQRDSLFKNGTLSGDINDEFDRSSEGVLGQTVSSDTTDSKIKEFPAITALKKIWSSVKTNCADAMLRDILISGSMIDGTMKSNNIKLRKEKKSSKGTAEYKPKTRRERPKELQTVGRSFLLEPDEQHAFLNEMQQCEICQVRFTSKGKSKKAHFGLSTLCDGCSERQLKIKKQQSSQSGFVSSLELNLRNLSPAEMNHSHAVILNNALFLLQMINSPVIGKPNKAGDKECSPIASEKKFECYRTLGVLECQIKEDEMSPNYDLFNSPVHNLRPKSHNMDAKQMTPLSGMTSDRNPDPLNTEHGTRKRKTSNGGENFDESGFTFLLHPSTALKKIVDAVTTDDEDEALAKMCSTVISFVTEKHELENLKLFLFQAIRRVTCRSYGMQILAWLMRNVSQPVGLHDLLWWYASSLEAKSTIDEEGPKQEGLDNGWWQMRSHPLTEFPASIFPLLTESFHTLLLTMADIMPFLPIGAPLLEMAVKCWGVSFTRKDHRFLHKSKIFRNLSQIMSKFDGENEWSKSVQSVENQESDFGNSNEITTRLEDITGAVEMKVSSRAALVSSLVDDSTETFWESGDEDRNRSKSITIACTSDSILKIVGVHIDNGRDSQYKVSSVSVKVGTHTEELIKVGAVEIDSRYFGWSWFPVEGDGIKVVRIDCKGPDNTLRIRQVKVLGASMDQSCINERSSANILIPRRKCENETLRIFRLLSSEVFGKLLSQVKRGDEDEVNDLQEHVVGILFSRNKLTYLQKQVCSHIVSAIHREAIKIKEEYDTVLTESVLGGSNDNNRIIVGEKMKIPDRYCFEMLSLVLALAGSMMGRSYLSQQSNLIQDLIQLLHAGTPRIQRQVTSVLRKILPEIDPSDFSKIVCCYEIQANGELQPRLGILDLLLGCIVKALQVKVRNSWDGSSRTAKQISIGDIFMSEELPSVYWFLRGDGDSQLACTVVKLIKDMCEETFSKEWASVTKPAIADSILYLTRIDAASRTSQECLCSPKFWISLAALCVLHIDHSKLMSSPVWQNGVSGRAKCTNHDDGETLAVMQCHLCGDLCGECDRILHLPKKNWSHPRKVCKEEEEAIRVDLHEGCGRIKLFWLMALADSSTLKTLVEFRNGIPKTFSESVSTVTSVGRCRFCNKSGSTGALALGNVCGESECQEYAKTACERVLECGHLCGGVRNETKCLPCLQGCSDKLGTILKQDADDMCMICFTDALAFAPAIQLFCGHVFHYHCCRTILDRKWAGPRIAFVFSLCPICKVEIAHNLLDDALNPIRELFRDVQRKAMMRLEYEGLNKADAIISPGSRFYKDPAGFAMDRYAYYVCFKCKKAYFGGEARCDVDIQQEFDPQELVCGGCSDVSQAQLCPKHGTDYLEYKCRYCCSVAVFFCFGTTHFCNGCHDDFQRITNIPKNQLPICPAGPRAKQLELEECPLHVSHPPTGEEFALGCGICRNAHTF